MVINQTESPHHQCPYCDHTMQFDDSTETLEIGVYWSWCPECENDYVVQKCANDRYLIHDAENWDIYL